MMALIENKGIEHFNALNDNAKAQIQYTYEVIQSDPVYKVTKKPKNRRISHVPISNTDNWVQY